MRKLDQLISYVRSLPQVQRIALILFSVLVIVLLNQWKPGLIGFAAVAAIFLGLVLRAKELAYKLKYPLLRRTWRGIFLFRKLFRVSPEVELLHIVTLLLVILSLLYLMSTKDVQGSNLLGNAAVITLLGSVVIDSGHQIFFLTRKAWARTLGKVALAALGATLYFAADAIAKNIIHSITHADPKYFPDAAGILVAGITPMLYLTIGSILAVIWAIAQLTVLGLLILLWQPIEVLGISSHVKDRAAYRIRTGRKAPIGYKAPIFSTNGFLFFMRPFGLLIAVVYLWNSIGAITTAYSAQITSHIQDLVVISEYHDDTLCRGLPINAKVSYLDNGLISVLEKTGAEMKFSIRPCQP